MSENGNMPPNLSKHQYRTLNFIRGHRVTVAQLRKAHGNTLGSIAYNDYVRRVGSGDNAEVILTSWGETALLAYEEDGMNERKREGDLTERCLRLLKHVRRIAEMQNSA